MMHNKKIRIFINGFGRIGRSAARILLDDSRFELVGINDVFSFKQMLSLLQYDSVYGSIKHKIELDKDHLLVENHSPVTLFNCADPSELLLSALDIDIVLECSGYFLTVESCRPFLDAGAKRVIVSTPPRDKMAMYIVGLNEKAYQNELVISNASCSANAIVPIFQILHEIYGIESAMLSMYHSYTSYQRLLDGKHYSDDMRRARSATQNIIPLQSSAAKATAYFFPHLDGRLYAKSIRIPLKAVTFYDLSIKVEKKTTLQKLRTSFTEAASQRFENILDFSIEPKVSSDYIQNPYSAVIDLPLCDVQDETLLRIAAWQDNEYGYARRLIDMAWVVSRKL
jgi:glyceraldehyde 3-phosphate dehydrogenase